MKWNLTGLMLAAFGAAVIVLERKQLTTPILIFAGGCIALGFFLVDSTDFKGFVATVGQYLPWGRKRDCP